MKWTTAKLASAAATTFCAIALQASPLATLQNSPLSIPASIIAAQCVPGSTNLIGSNFLMSAVSPASSQGGQASLINSQQWAQRYPISSQSQQSSASAMVVRPDGSIVATGSSDNGPWATRNDFLTIAYSADGKPLWTNLYDGPAHLDDSASYITTSPGGDVWVAGTSSRTVTNFGTTDVVLIKYSNNGLPLFTNQFTTADTNSDYPEALLTDTTGSTYLLASSTYWLTNNGIPLGYTLIKYDSSGIPLWTNQFAPYPNEGFGDIVSMAVDEAGNFFIAGDLMNGHYARGGGVVKLTPDGVPLWTNVCPSISPVRGIVVDRLGNVIFTGESISPSYSVNYVMTKISAAGDTLWTNTMAGPNYDGGYVPQALVDAIGNVFLIGGKTGTSSSGSYQILKVTSNGVPLWTNLTANLQTNDSQIVASGVDNAGNLFLTGLARYTSPSNADIVTIKFSCDGSALWTNRFDGSGLSDYPAAMIVDDSGNVVIAGEASVSNHLGICLSCSSIPQFTVIKYADLMFYTPPKNFIGTDSIDYTVTDGLGNQATTNLSVLVTPGEFQLSVSSPTNLTPAGLNLTVDATPTIPLIIETSTDLINWQPIQTNSNLSGSVELLDPSATNQPQQFYRAVIQGLNPAP